MKAVKTNSAIKCGGKHFKAGETLLVGKGKEISLKDAKYLVNAGAVFEVVAPTKEKENVSVEEMLEVADLSTLSVAQLKAICKDRNLTPYSNKKEHELIEMIEEYRNDTSVDLDLLSRDELIVLADEEGIAISDEMSDEEIRETIDEAMAE